MTKRALRVALAAITLLAVHVAGSTRLAPAPAAGAATLTAPQHVVAVQGPSDPNTRYVHVSWDRAVRAAVAHEIFRNGVFFGSVAVAGDPWDDFSMLDRSVSTNGTYRYQVRAVLPDGSTGPLSAEYRITVRGNENVGSGRIFTVDSYPGTDIERAEAAVKAAKAAGGGIVQFGARLYQFSRALQLGSTRDIVLRGAGMDQTFIQASSGGPTGDACSVTPKELIVFSGTRRTLSDVHPAVPIAVGDRTVRVTSTSGLKVGQVVILDESAGEYSAASFAKLGVVEDPGTGRDRRTPWDANEIVAVGDGTVTFRYPWSAEYSTAVPWQLMEGSSGNGVEMLTLQGRSSSDTGYYRLIRGDHTAHFSVADVRGRWANRNFLELKGYDIKVTGFQGPDGGPASYDGASCKYKITAYRISNLVFVNGTMGDPTHDRNQSFLTVQKGARTLVRASRFYGSRTYAVNEHGSGGRHHVIENNYISVGPNAKFGGVLLGNNTWGFSGPAIVRNNAFRNNSRDLALQENSYEVRFVDNTSRGNRSRIVDEYGWAGPFTTPDLYGSLRMTITGNDVQTASGDGIVLGYSAGTFPYTGVRDVVIMGNRLDVSGKAFVISGTADRVRVENNTGTAKYSVPRLGSTSRWVNNPDGTTTTGTAIDPEWQRTPFAWEPFDTGV